MFHIVTVTGFAMHAAKSGELDRATFRALRSVPYAMGHLARSDERALDWLLHAVDYRNTGPHRSFRHMNRHRVARLLRRAAMTGLALSGHPEAERVLSRLARSRKPHVRKHAIESLHEHDRIVTDGAHAVLGQHARDLR